MLTSLPDPVEAIVRAPSVQPMSMQKMHARSLRIVALLSVLFALQNAASAGLVISFYEDGGNVWMSLSGEGTVPTGVGNPGSSLEILNFTGTPFVGVPDAPYGFSNSTLAVTAGNANLAINGVMLTGEGANQSDLTLMLSGSIGQNTAYEFSGSALVTGLTLARLVAGTYDATNGSGNQGDQDAFSQVRMSIDGPAAVSTPEPASLAMMGVAALGLCGTGLTRRKRKLAAAGDAAPSLS
jgi:hypothetical protein